MSNTKGSIVLANAGRDQDGLFFVVGEADGFVLLADGKRRKLEHPKRKNVLPSLPLPLDSSPTFLSRSSSRSAVSGR